MKDFLLQKINKDSFKDSKVKRAIKLTVCFACILALCHQFVGCLSLKTYAAEDYTLSGKWRINDEPIISHYPFTTENINFTSNGKNYTGFAIVKNGAIYSLKYSGSSTVTAYSNTTKWQGDYHEVDFGSTPQSVTSAFYTWFTTYAEQFTCDNSVCQVPVEQVVNGEICPVCGMMFSVLRDYTPNDFPSGYPAVPSVSADARYYLYTVQSTGRTYLVIYPGTVTPTYDTTKQNGYLYFAECYGYYELDTTNNEWTFVQDDSPYFIGGTNNNSVNIHYSSVTIKDQNGENFFPIPLWERVEQVTQGELPNLTETLGGNLMTVVLCGVGCLALLMGLVLLSRISKTYRR